jgi:hypothetical protein
MFTYDITALTSSIKSIIQNNLALDQWTWLQEKAVAVQAGQVVALNSAFAAMPRKTGKKPILLSEEQGKAIHNFRSGLAITGWSTDRLCRLWLLIQLHTYEKNVYFRTIENLFIAAEMNELIALYSSLPVLAFPEMWKLRCSEGVRSNIGPVLESIICDNPYPSENLDDPAWNQLVMKAFFTEKPIHRIIGLDKRANADLANMLIDYAHERWAAHRTVHPQLWRCVEHFIDDKNFQDLERLATSVDSIEREAAALACARSNYLPAQALAMKTQYFKLIEDGKLTWQTLAEKAAVVSI